MLRRWLSWLVAFSALLVPAAASATPPTKAELRQMLSGYEHTPSADTWRALGTEALPVLIDLYDDAGEPPYVRLRTVHAVSFYPSPATRTFLLAVARAPRQSDLFVRQAVLSLVRAFGARSVADVAPFLTHAEAVVREAAAAGLGRVRTEAARDALRARLPLEADDTVRGAIARALEEPGR
jgi:HEAT repeat protein